MMLRRILGWLAALAAVSFAPTSSFAQFRQIVPDDMLNSSLSSSGSLRFCVNSASALVEFDRSVGAALADVLLLRPEFHDLTYPAAPFPFEYTLPLPEEELFIQVTNNCDALLGFPLPEVGQVFDWLTVTPPYYRPGFVLALSADAPDTLSEMPSGTQIGSRLGIMADMYVRAHLQTSDNDLRRRVYPNNRAMINDLTSGALSAAILWEPALSLAAQADPEVAGIRAVAPSFELAPVQFAIAVPSNQTYLRQVLDQAIAEFRTSGMLTDFLDEFGLPDER